MRKYSIIIILSIVLVVGVACGALADEIYLPIATTSADGGNETTDEAPASDLSSDYLGAYTIDDTGFGTMVTVTVDDEAQTRTIASNALPNHETGEFPNSGNPNTISEQDKAWTLPTEPTFVGTPTEVRETGVAINGVKFEPGTAERATCDGGEVHRVEAIQSVMDLGLDFNNAHVQPTGEYHYHGVSDLLVDVFDSDQDLVHIAFAGDGHLIYYSKSGAYEPGYRLGEGERAGTNCAHSGLGPNGQPTVFGPEKDGALTSDWAFDESNGQLDECNGITIDGQYIYLITNEYPYIPRCLMGEVAGPGAGGPPPDGPPTGGPGGPPDFSGVAEILGVTEQEFRDALGPPPPNLDATAERLDITVAELEAAFDAAGVRLGPPQR